MSRGGVEWRHHYRPCSTTRPTGVRVFPLLLTDTVLAPVPAPCKHGALCSFLPSGGLEDSWRLSDLRHWVYCGGFWGPNNITARMFISMLGIVNPVWPLWRERAQKFCTRTLPGLPGSFPPDPAASLPAVCHKSARAQVCAESRESFYQTPQRRNDRGDRTQHHLLGEQNQISTEQAAIRRDSGLRRSSLNRGWNEA